jgi:hypothetical protein
MSPRDEHGGSRIRDLVEARLGRPPQDKLEAAVVLEAWGGLRPPHALEVAGQAVGHTHGGPILSVGRPRESRRRDKAAVAEGLTLLAAVLAVAMWTVPFGRALGNDVWDGAVRMALPITLGGQWMLRSRSLGRPDGLEVLRRDRLVLACLLAGGASLAATQSDSAFVALLLIVTWLGGTVLIRRGWGLVYVALLVIVTIEVNIGVAALPTLAASTAATLLLVTFVVGAAGETRATAGRLQRASAAGLMGAAVGGLLVLDPSIGWGTAGVLPALALIPSTAGSFWGGYHLWRFYDDVPRALAGVPVAEADRAAVRGPAMSVLAGAFARLAGTTAVLSVLVMLVAESGGEAYAGDTAGRAALLTGFALIALATLLISLLQTLGFPSWALVTLACALAAEIAVASSNAAPFNGAALVTGAAVAVLLALPPIISLFLRPGRVLATILWIS